MAVTKGLQLAAAIGLLVLFWAIYPGALLLIAVGVAVLYIAAAVGAFFSRLADRIALAFTVPAIAFAGWGVYRYTDNGFNWLGGHFDGRDGVYWPAYLFLSVGLCGGAAILRRALTRERRTGGRAIAGPERPLTHESLDGRGTVHQLAVTPTERILERR